MRTASVETGAFASRFPSLTARNLQYRVHAGLSIRVPALEIHARQMLGVLGPNGAGKTTLMNLLTGRLRPVHGELVIKQRPVHAMTADELAGFRTVVRASADSGGSGLTAREVMELGALSNPIPTRLLHVLIAAYAQAFGLISRLDTDFERLSSGEKKRVEITRALIQVYGREEEHILFLDEPFAHLDARHAEAVRKELCSLKDRGVALLLILHDINFAAHHCDRILLMRQGQIAADITPSDIYDPLLLEKVYDTHFVISRSGRRKYVIAKQT